MITSLQKQPPNCSHVPSKAVQSASWDRTGWIFEEYIPSAASCTLVAAGTTPTLPRHPTQVTPSVIIRGLQIQAAEPGREQGTWAGQSSPEECSELLCHMPSTLSQCNFTQCNVQTQPWSLCWAQHSSLSSPNPSFPWLWWPETFSPWILSPPPSHCSKALTPQALGTG